MLRPVMSADNDILPAHREGNKEVARAELTGIEPQNRDHAKPD